MVAATDAGVIGRHGDLPWHLPEDLRFFQQLTTGHVVLAGRRTHASIVARLGRPLPGRITVVVSSTCTDGAVVHGTSPAHGIELARTLAAWAGQDEVFLIGGAQLYAACLPHVDRVHLTRVHADVEGDTSLPAGWLDGFRLTESVSGAAGASLPFSHEQWERRTGSA